MLKPVRTFEADRVHFASWNQNDPTHTSVGGIYDIFGCQVDSGLVMVYIDWKTARLKSKTEGKSLRDL